MNVPSSEDRREPPADVLALVNARLLVQGPRDGVALSPATAVLIENGEIADIADDRSVREQARGKGDVVDVHGATLAPGFIDAHVHAFDCAVTSLTVSCLPPSVDSISVLKARLRERAAVLEPGSWVIGTGYDDSRLRESRHPTRDDLDEAAPMHPVVLSRVCGHMSVANTRALELAGIRAETGNPQGGAIVRDERGEPTGLLLEQAQRLVQEIVPPANEEQILRALIRTGEAMLTHGITAICEALLGVFHPHEASIWSRVLSDGWRGPRVSFLQDPSMVEHMDASRLPVIGTKLFADGVITGRTAAVTDPFQGTDEVGILIHTIEELTNLVANSIARGLPVGIHAMGDQGIGAAIEAIGRAETATSEAIPPSISSPRRDHRIEHCSLPRQDSLSRMKEMRIVPVPQPVFLFAEGEAYREAVGDGRCECAYPLRTMIDLGLRPAMSSDAPATSWDDSLNPWLGVTTAVTRTTWAGTQLGTAEAISVAEALAGYSANGAAVMGAADRIGSVGVGKDADLILLPDDPLEVPPDQLPSLRPIAVLLRGEVVSGQLP